MANNTQIRGVISYLIRLTHTSGAFRFKFVNVDVFKKFKNQQSYPEIHYDLEITSGSIVTRLLEGQVNLSKEVTR